MNQKLRLWLRAANPMIPPRGMAEAQRSARVGAAALVIGAVQGLAGLPTLSDKMEQSAALMMQGGAVPAQDQAMFEGVMTAMTPVMIGGVVVLSAVYLVLAVVQWRKMTWLIPALMLAFLAYSLLSMVNGFALLGEEAGQLYGPLAVVQWIIMLATGFLYAAAVRGGLMLSRLKRSF
ncbi:hypothetical protein [Brevundimonas guildfordensis]|uniref:DUF2127 domain-containing protein n=1 Tax=Brevundimonas guildfordensis TaxID=2762241 RepID=A0ABR8QYQ5_9CAUL|nr:hypothetical protein [Brevundimonas guildfordensis]MBD7940661.1 hypothetical protein [Brevundimonas guildfordensis]